VERTAKYALEANSSVDFQGYFYGTLDILKLNYSYTSDGNGTSFLWYLVFDLYDDSILYNVPLSAGSGTVKLPVPVGHKIAVNLIASSFSLATEGGAKEISSSASATFSYELVAPTSDNDEDEVPNEIDQCPGTPIGSVVDPANGCSIDELVPCNPMFRDWESHGEYVSSYADTVSRFVALGVLPPGEGAGLITKASMSKCGAE
jgi:hypothetical protein